MKHQEPRYFFIIGAMKAGTTSLFKYLQGHPDLYASPKKEPRIFKSAGAPGTQGAALRALFEGRRMESWCFEASTAYTKYPLVGGVPKRIQSVAPNARFVYVVRNPVARTWSHYTHNLAQGRESRDFVSAIQDSPQYVEISRYGMQMQQYLQVFPKDRFLILVFEEMVRDPVTTVRQVCRFLEVDDSFAPDVKGFAFNSSSSKRTAPAALRVMASAGLAEKAPWRLRQWLRRQGPPLPVAENGLLPDMRKQIAGVIRPDTEVFFSLIGRRIPSWPDFS
jgi:hypothetical protein